MPVALSESLFILFYTDGTEIQPIRGLYFTGCDASKDTYGNTVVTAHEFSNLLNFRRGQERGVKRQKCVAVNQRINCIGAIRRESLGKPAEVARQLSVDYEKWCPKQFDINGGSARITHHLAISSANAIQRLVWIRLGEKTDHYSALDLSKFYTFKWTCPEQSVKPNSTLREAVTLMLTHDFSQLPVMQSERDVKGVVSWESIGRRLAAGDRDETVTKFMVPHHELSADISLFAAIGRIVEHDYVLIRDHQKKITGIVTTSDLSLQFHQLGEPFLLLGEIENHIRRLVGGKFTQEELTANRDPADAGREVSSVSDLTFGEYVWLLQNPDNWERLDIFIDRGVFIGQLDKIRLIRNDVMHFDPDGLSPSDLETLRSFVLFLQRLRELTDNKH